MTERFIILSLIVLAILVINRKIIKEGEPVVITNLVTVFILFVNYFGEYSQLLNEYSTSFCYICLAFVSFVSLVIKKPFTIYYAKVGVSEEKQKHILFYMINKYITLAWVIIFTINGVLNLLFEWSAELRMVTIGFICVGVYLSKYLPRFIRNHYRVRQAGV